MRPLSCSVGLVALSIAFSTTETALAAPNVLLERHSTDAEDLLALERKYPAAKDLLLEGEKLLAAGNNKRAEEVLRRAMAQAPENGLVNRRVCQATIALGERSAALAACWTALEKKKTPMTQRAAVQALMLQQPTPTEVAQAERLAEIARQNMPTQPWGSAAYCDIAARLGDRALHAKCLKELEALAPGHYETERARAAHAFAEPSRWAIAGWLAIAIAIVGTMAHAVWDRVRRLRLKTAAAAASAVLLLTFAAAAQESNAGPQAGGLSKFKINDDDPLKSVPTPDQRDKDPLHFGYHLMDLADHAQWAADKGDHLAAAKYWEATVKAVPDAAVGYRKTCAEFELAGQAPKALAYCRGALGQQGVVLSDYDRYATLLLSQKEPLNTEQLADLSETATHLKTVEGGADLGARLDCEFAIRADDMPRLEKCTQALAASLPDDPKTITYQWALALKREQFAEAQQFIERAKKTAMKPEGVKTMQDATAQASSFWGRMKRRGKVIGGVVVGVVVLVALLGGAWLLTRRRPKVPPPAPVQA